MKNPQNDNRTQHISTHICNLLTNNNKGITYRTIWNHSVLSPTIHKLVFSYSIKSSKRISVDKRL